MNIQRRNQGCFSDTNERVSSCLFFVSDSIEDIEDVRDAVADVFLCMFHSVSMRCREKERERERETEWNLEFASPMSSNTSDGVKL